MSPATSARRTLASVLAGAAALAAYACADGARTTAPSGAAASRGEGNVLRQYGPPARLGQGRARTYVLLDARTRAALEVGVALDKRAMEGLPAPMPMPPGGGGGHEHLDSHVYDLKMPAQNPTPFTFVELDWNPAGHEIAGIYDVPHFDFHFYVTAPEQRNAIDPADPRFQQRADNLPAEALRPAFYSTMTPPGAPTPAVPRMGVHWVDVRSPELQGLLGRPENARPFTTTFLFGSWDGDFIFAEPMVTRAFILGRKEAATAAQRDSVIQLPAAQQQRLAGQYPGAYHVTWDGHAREYRVGLQQLAR
jgi:hypothetical protein